MSIQIDHVVFCVEDLARAAEYLAKQHGLVSHPGGRHPGHGTANRIVPLGDTYLELVAVLDPEEAAESAFGSWVTSRAIASPVPHALCLRTDDIDEVSDRLELEAVAMARDKPDGSVLEWHLAGLELAITDGLPFFVEWHVPEERLPGRATPGNEAKVDGVILAGDVPRLKKWTEGAERVTVQTQDRPIQVVLQLGDGGVALLPT